MSLDILAHTNINQRTHYVQRSLANQERLMQSNLASGSDARDITSPRWAPLAWVNTPSFGGFSTGARRRRKSLRTGVMFITFNCHTNPHAVRFPAGQAQKLSQEMERLVEDLRAAIPAAFETDEYRARHHEIDAEFNDRQAKTFEEVRVRAAKKDVALIQTPSGGFAFAPMRNGEVQKDFVDNAESFRQPKEGEQVTLFGVAFPQSDAAEGALRRYRVNVLVDHSASTGAPVIYEDNLTYNNLVGRIEHLQQMGVLALARDSHRIPRPDAQPRKYRVT